MINITTPLTKDVIKTLKAGDSLLLSGVIYTARDAAHKRMCEDYEKGIPFPIELSGQLIYYAGPCPAKPGEVSALAGLQPPAGWMRMHRCCLIRGLVQCLARVQETVQL